MLPPVCFVIITSESEVYDLKDLTIDNYIQIGLLIITITSVFSPVIVTLLNNIHDTKIKKLELNSAIKKEVLSEFALHVSRQFNSEFVNEHFRKSLNLLYVYFDVDDDLINQLLENKFSHINQFQSVVTSLMKKLSKQIKDK